MSLSVHELAVLDRWDAGMSIEAIAADLGKSKGYVQNMVSYYDGGRSKDPYAAARIGSQKLLVAIQRASLTA